MTQINEIYRVSFMSHSFSYVGTLRNEKKFNLHDIVFAAVGSDLIKCKISGVELPPEDNPEYKYKVTIPSSWVQRNMPNLDDFYVGKNLDKITLNCDRIFGTIQEAKQSAIDHMNRMYELQKNEIEKYFSQFEELQMKAEG